MLEDNMHILREYSKLIVTNMKIIFEDIILLNM